MRKSLHRLSKAREVEELVPTSLEVRRKPHPGFRGQKHMGQISRCVATLRQASALQINAKLPKATESRGQEEKKKDAKDSQANFHEGEIPSSRDRPGPLSTRAKEEMRKMSTAPLWRPHRATEIQALRPPRRDHHTHEEEPLRSRLPRERRRSRPPPTRCRLFPRSRPPALYSIPIGPSSGSASRASRRRKATAAPSCPSRVFGVRRSTARAAERTSSEERRSNSSCFTAATSRSSTTATACGIWCSTGAASLSSTPPVASNTTAW